MVLSNKKLKQKLRAVKAELITESGAQNNFSDKNYEKSQNLSSKASDALRTILNLEAQRSKLSKREKPKRVKQRPNAPTENADNIKKEEISGDVEVKLEDGLNSDTMQVEKKKKKKKKKMKKRKRDESEESENLRKKRKKKRPRNWWMLKKKKTDNNKIEEIETGAVKEEVVKQYESGSTGEQIVVAKADNSFGNDRKIIEIPQKVYVGGIPYYSTEDDIRSYFEGCGTITCIDCLTFPDTGKFRGIAIITFKTEAAAKRALALDGSDMGGLFLKIQPYKSSRESKLPNFSPSVAEGYNRIYVGNLSWDITEDDLRNILVGCTIKTIRFGEDKETGEFKGYAHVDLADSLSLKTALKLDQTVVRGRPIRVSCAVLKNGTASTLKPMLTNNQFDSGKEVTAASVKAEDNQHYTDNFSVAVENQVTSSEANAASSKIRRRTCYECGERGHLSSACPKIQAGNHTNPDNNVDSYKEVPASYSKAVPEDNRGYSFNGRVEVDNQVTTNETNVSSSKIRRRTCYECGERGHLSSACPKIQAGNLTNPDNKVDSFKEVPAVNSRVVPEDNRGYSFNCSVEVENQVSTNETNVSSSKVRRRTCYECGEKGHLSSACPKVQAADSTNTDNQAINGKEVTAASSKVPSVDNQVYNDNISIKVENQAADSGTNVLSSKIRRRTCYECGEKGHLSSACPKLQAADPTNPGTT